MKKKKKSSASVEQQHQGAEHGEDLTVEEEQANWQREMDARRALQREVEEDVRKTC